MAKGAMALTFWVVEDGERPSRHAHADFEEPTVPEVAQEIERMYAGLKPTAVPHQLSISVGHSSYGWPADASFSKEFADLIWAKYLALAAFDER